LPIINIAAKLSTSGALQWATFLGANLPDQDPSDSRIAIDAAGDAYILGQQGIPPTPNAFNPTSQPASQILNFLVKIAPSLGAPVPLASPNSLPFGTQNVGTSSAAIDVQLGNFGDAPMSPVFSISGDFSETDNCASPVPGGQKCDINVVFKPTASGPRTGILTLSFGGSVSSQTIALSGAGVTPAVSLSPTSLSFGIVPNGTTTDAQQVTVTNSGTGTLLLSSVQTSSQFAATNTCGSPLGPSGSCTIQITFTPTSSGSQTGTLAITDNATNSPQTVALAGNQLAAITVAASASSSTSATVSAGQTATYNLTVAGTNGFSGAVNFTCAGAPMNSTCSVAPNPANVTPKTPVSVTVTVATKMAGLVTIRQPYRPPFFNGTIWLAALAITLALLLGLATVLQGFVTLQRAVRVRNAYAGAFAVVLLAAICISCGGGSVATPPTNPGTQSGQYTVTVTATSGSLTQPITLSLTVK
jgi:hypothetical protein